MIVKAIDEYLTHCESIAKDVTNRDSLSKHLIGLQAFGWPIPVIAYTPQENALVTLVAFAFLLVNFMPFFYVLFSFIRKFLNRLEEPKQKRITDYE